MQTLAARKRNQSQPEARRPILKDIFAAAVCKLAFHISSCTYGVPESTFPFMLTCRTSQWNEITAAMPVSSAFWETVNPAVVPNVPVSRSAAAAAVSPSSHRQLTFDLAKPRPDGSALLGQFGKGSGTPAAPEPQPQWQVQALLPHTRSSADTQPCKTSLFHRHKSLFKSVRGL